MSININTTIETSSGRLLITEQVGSSTLVSIDRPVGDDTDDTDIMTVEVPWADWEKFLGRSVAKTPKAKKPKKVKK